MYATNISLDIDIDLEFDAIVEPVAAPDSGSNSTYVATRVPKARCADGNGTLTHLFFSDVPLDTDRKSVV